MPVQEQLQDIIFTHFSLTHPTSSDPPHTQNHFHGLINWGKEPTADDYSNQISPPTHQSFPQPYKLFSLFFSLLLSEHIFAQLREPQTFLIVRIFFHHLVPRVQCMIIANDATVKGGTYYPIQGPSSCPLGVMKSGLVRLVRPKECRFLLLHPEEAGDSRRVLYRGDFMFVIYIIYIIYILFLFIIILRFYKPLTPAPPHQSRMEDEFGVDLTEEPAHALAPSPSRSTSGRRRSRSRTACRASTSACSLDQEGATAGASFGNHKLPSKHASRHL